MLTQERIEALRAPFPAEALKPDTSRGFELTSIKAAYVIERLNEVFGPMHYEGYHRRYNGYTEYVALAVCNRCGHEISF